MAEEIVHVEWGIMMAACHISLMYDEKFGPSLQVRGDEKIATTSVLKGLFEAVKDKAKVPLASITRFLPAKNDIEWDDHLSGDQFLGYEIRGKGPDFKVWMIGGGNEDTSRPLNDAEKLQRYTKLRTAIDLFFP